MVGSSELGGVTSGQPTHQQRPSGHYRQLIPYQKSFKLFNLTEFLVMTVAPMMLRNTDLHKLHHRHRIEEMEPTKSVLPGGGVGQLRDLQG